MSEQFEDNEVYPVEASESGHNAYYIDGCKVVNQRPPYAACLKKIAQRKSGRLDTQYADCSAAIGHKECPAQKMRKEELTEGKAIYFFNRKKFQSFMQYQDEIKQQNALATGFKPAPRGKMTKIPAAPPTPKHFLDVNAGNYADALNAAMKSVAPVTAPPAVKPVEQMKSAPVAPIKAGMSMMEMARLQLAAQNQSN